MTVMSASTATFSTVTSDQPAPPPEDELATILATPASLTVAGIPVLVKRIKTKELLVLMRAITNGIGEDFSKFRLDPDADDFASQVTGLLVVAFPNAAEDFVELFGSLIEPRDSNRANEIREAMHNPEIDDALDIFAVLMEQERADFARLWGKARVLFGHAMALYNKQSTTKS